MNLAHRDIRSIERRSMSCLQVLHDIKVAWATKWYATLELVCHVSEEVSVGLAVVVFFDHFHEESEIEIVMLQFGRTQRQCYLRLTPRPTDGWHNATVQLLTICANVRHKR